MVPLSPVPKMTRYGSGFLVAGLLLGLLFVQSVISKGRECNSSSSFACRSDPSHCIPLSRVRDGKPDCLDKSDERCFPGEFLCHCGQPLCVSSKFVKDGIRHCSDGSDEEEPGSPATNCSGDPSRTRGQRTKRQVGIPASEDAGLRRPIGFSRERPPPSRRAYIRRVRPVTRRPPPVPTRTIPIDEDGEVSAFSEPFEPITHHQEPNIAPNPSPYALIEGGERYHHEQQDQVPAANTNNPTSYPKRVIRLRRPGVSQPAAQSPPGQRGRLVVARRPISAQPSQNIGTVRARGPVGGREIPEDQPPRNALGQNGAAQIHGIQPSRRQLPVLPLTYYTTYTYLTTFLNGPLTSYTTREDITSSVVEETINPEVVRLIRAKGGFTTPPEGNSVIPLGSRTFEATTTVVNLASNIQVFNSEVYYGPSGEDTQETRSSVAPVVHGSGRRGANANPATTGDAHVETMELNAVAALPKTYYTLYTTFYTFFDGVNNRHSLHSETVSNVVTDMEPLLKRTVTNSIDGSGFMTLGPERELINLGSREVAGTTTEINLELNTLVRFGSLRNVVLRKPDVQPTAVAAAIVPTATDFQDNGLESEPDEPNTLHALPIQPSFPSVSSYFGNLDGRPQGQATPEIPIEAVTPYAESSRRGLRVVSTIVQRPGDTLRSSVPHSRNRVRVRVRPVTSRRLQPTRQPTVPVTPALEDSERLEAGRSINQAPPPVNEHIPTAETPQNVQDETEAPPDDRPTTPPASSPVRKRLKVTVRRQQPASAVRANSRFVHPSRFDPSSRSRFFVVTKTNGAARSTNRPHSVKVSKRLRPGEATPEVKVTDTSQFQTYTTATSVPSVLGLEPSYVSVPVSSPVLDVPLNPSPIPFQPLQTVVYTYFTTSTFTVPVISGNQAVYTTHKETNSRVVTKTIAAGDEEYSSELALDSPVIAPSSSVPTVVEVTSSPIPTFRFVDQVPSPIRPQTLPPSQVVSSQQTIDGQFNIAGRANLVTRVSNGVTLIVASGSDTESIDYHSQANTPVTLQPTLVTDVVVMKDKGSLRQEYETKEFYTTVTLFTTLFSGDQPFITSAEHIITETRTVPVDRNPATTTFIAPHAPPEPPGLIVPDAASPYTITQTSESIVTNTLYETNTVFATLFNGPQTIVTPIEETVSQVVTSTETFTITLTILPTPTTSVQTIPTVQPSIPTFTTFFTPSDETIFFSSSQPQPVPSSEPKPTPGEETIIFGGITQSEPELLATYTKFFTKTHYLTVDKGQTTVSSIEEILSSVVIEPISALQEAKTTSKPPEQFTPVEITTILSTPPTIEPTSTQTKSDTGNAFQDLVPSVHTQYTTLTYFTTVFKDSTAILSSREEVATSYITVFVPSSETLSARDSSAVFLEPVATTEETIFFPTTTEPPSPSHQTDFEVLTFYTTYSFPTTIIRGTETIISESESVVTVKTTIARPPDSTRRIHPSIHQPRPADARTTTTSTISTIYTFSPTETQEPSLPSTSEVITSEVSSSSTTTDTAPSVVKEDITSSIEPSQTSPSILTGTPTVDANGSTLIILTNAVSNSTSLQTSTAVSDTSTVDDVTMFKDTLQPSVAKETPALPESVLQLSTSSPGSAEKSDQSTSTNATITTTPNGTIVVFTTSDISAVTEAKFATLADSPTIPTDEGVSALTPPLSSGASGADGGGGEVKPSIIELADFLNGNTNIGANIGEVIKNVVNLWSNSQTETLTPAPTKEQPVLPPSGGVAVSNAGETVYIPIGAIGRSTQDVAPVATEEQPPTPATITVLGPGKISTGFTPLTGDQHPSSAVSLPTSEPSVKRQDSTEKMTASTIIGESTVFISPTPASDAGRGSQVETSSTQPVVEGSTDITANDLTGKSNARPPTQDGETSVITGVQTIFFETTDARTPHRPSEEEEPKIQGTVATSSVVGIETIFFDTAREAPKSSPPVSSSSTREVHISGSTTIFGTYPAFNSESTGTQPTPTSSPDGATIFFPLPGQRVPGLPTPVSSSSEEATRYVTNVEPAKVATMTSTVTFFNNNTPVEVATTVTTTIPAKTFVSTIIGNRTIFGQPLEPTVAVQSVPTARPTETTTTVTDTTLIFSSIPTTVVRTFVITTSDIQATAVSTQTSTSTATPGRPGQPSPAFVVPFHIGRNRSRPAPPTPPSTKGTTMNRKGLFNLAARPTAPTVSRPAFSGPKPKLSFPTPPSTTPTPPPQLTTPRRRPTDRKTRPKDYDDCWPECRPELREMCRQNAGTWECVCKVGFARKNTTDMCEEAKAYVVLLRLIKMGESDMAYKPEFSNRLSSEYKQMAGTARKVIGKAHESTKLNYLDSDVNSILDGKQLGRSVGLDEGVIVNFTVHVSRNSPANESFLKEELTKTLEFEPELDLNASESVVSSIIQRIEDVRDFDECADPDKNDCSRSAICENTLGSYTCTCREGYIDLDVNYKGRTCSGEIKNCDYCNGRGDCIMTEDDKKICRCHRMYIGKQCEVNGLVLAIVLPIALALLIVTFFCLVCGCRRLRRRRNQKTKANMFRGMVGPMGGTLDRKAMIMDSSSESSGEHGARPLHAYDGFGDEGNVTPKKVSKRIPDHSLERSISTGVPPVVIPRAKHQHPKQVNHPPYKMGRW